MGCARGSLPILILLLALRATAQFAPQEVLSRPLTFAWNDPLGDPGCKIVLAETPDNAVPFELRGPGKVLADGAVQLDSSEVLLNGAACSAAGHSRTMTIRAGPAPALPEGMRALDLFGPAFSAVDKLMDFWIAGAFVAGDGATADGLCTTGNQTFGVSRLLVFSFTDEFIQPTLHLEHPLVFRAGEVYTVVEMDAGVEADVGNGSRVPCFFVEAPPPASSSSSEPEKPDAPATLSTGAIIGFGVGATGLLAFAVVLLALAHSRRKKREMSAMGV